MIDCVNFPWHLDHDTQDGTFIYLVGIPKKTELWDRVRLEYDDIPVGDGTSNTPTAVIEKHFKYNDSEEEFNNGGFSIDYRFAILIAEAPTNWWWEDWTCKESDLTQRGKELLEMLRFLHSDGHGVSDCDIEILTISST